MIRIARPEDAAAIARVHIRSWQQAYRDLLPDDFLLSLEATLDRRTGSWRDSIEKGAAVLVAEVGAELVGWHYKPLFPYFADHPGAFRVLSDDYVTSESGTGIVHQVCVGVSELLCCC